MNKNKNANVEFDMEQLLPKSHIELYNRIKTNKRLMKKERDYLRNYVKEGSRPLFGYPHMVFKEKGETCIGDFENQAKQYWNKFAKSILND